MTVVNITLILIFCLSLLGNCLVLICYIIKISKKKSYDDSSLLYTVDAKEVLDQLPVYLFWKNRNGELLGCNQQYADYFKLRSWKDLIGKTDYSLFSQAEADMLRMTDEEVMRTGKAMKYEEECTTCDGIKRLYLARKKPLLNKNNQIIGVVVVSVDITDTKRSTMNRLKILENIIAIMPGKVYWMDKDGLYLGCNDNQAKSIGFSSRQDIIGKCNSDIYEPNTAQACNSLNKEIMETGKILTIEESISSKDGQNTINLSTKTPLYDYNNKITGMVGVSLDITDRKKTELLKLETELQKAKLQEQNNFKKTVDQLVHDIRSPLASLLMVLKSCEANIPELARIALRGAAASISDIADNLLNSYKLDKSIQKQSSLMVASAVLQFLIEKKHQYKDSKIIISNNFQQGCAFAFIDIDPMAFKRMISNVFNNAIESLENKTGAITINISMQDEKYIQIAIKDSGQGMLPEIANKILNKAAITFGKTNGHGIGFTQIHDTLINYNGKLAISSQKGAGTEILLTFPVVATPDWIAKEIHLYYGDTVIMLDDDNSMHHAWNSCFAKFGNNINLKHFTLGQEAVDFINGFVETEKILLLADFELLRQELNGLQVIATSGIKRSILVTSHYTDRIVLDTAQKNATKILPKHLAAEVVISIQ